VLDVLYHHAKFGGARISGAAGADKNVEFFVCLSVRHAVEREFTRPISPRMRWSTETISVPLNRGICVCIRV